MSLYNLLFGENKIARILKIMLELDEFGEWSSGRYRDLFLKDENTIILYTRNGAGNRECVEMKNDMEIENCSGCLFWDAYTCPARACVILPKHPYYVRDWDDDFDPTYAYFLFRVPEKYKEIAKILYEIQGCSPLTVSERFDGIVKEIRSMSKDEIANDPRFKPMIKILEDILENII